MKVNDDGAVTLTSTMIARLINNDDTRKELLDKIEKELGKEWRDSIAVQCPRIILTR